jgi:hypothetical protein
MVIRKKVMAAEGYILAIAKDPKDRIKLKLRRS